MNNLNAAELCQGVSYSNSTAEFGSADNAPVVVVDTAYCRAVVSLLGAQVLSFIPRGGRDWLWLSPRARFTEGQAIRGGIPLCLPWFGVNRHQPGLPKHGFLRSREWQLRAAECMADGAVRLRFEISSAEGEFTQFPWRYQVVAEMVFSDTLRLQLTISNSSATTMPLSFAMHSYLAVNGLDSAVVSGLDGQHFLDNTDELRRKLLRGEQRFEGEVDRVFEGVRTDQRIETSERRLRVSGTGCDTVIVWNPGAVLARTMADVGDSYGQYVCVERGRAFADEIELDAGAEWRAEMCLSQAP